MDSHYKSRQLFYYKLRHGLLQIATDITKCDDYYSTATVQGRFLNKEREDITYILETRKGKQAEGKNMIKNL